MNKTLIISMIFIFSVFFPFSAKTQGQQYALLIGIDQYAKEVGNLDGAKNDIELLENALNLQLGTVKY